MSDLDHRLAVATEVVRKAGRLARDYFDRRHELTIELKGKQDLVSVADKSVEALIRRELGAAFPGDVFLGEEGGGTEAPRSWVIDPIDGTSNFLRGMPYWSCVLAYVVDGITELGLTIDPIHDELFVARRGHGATRNGETIRVSPCDDPGRACVAMSFNFKLPPETYVRILGGLAAEGFDHRRMGSAALQLCHVADGRVEAAMAPLASSWDVIAGLCIAEEAGAVATRWTDGCALTGTRASGACAPGVVEPFERATGLVLRRP
ncbi:MAG TPA: inositol monophosphatase [Geminicoccaceae bacterium]|nr:inositol monophosphatase [Geminicoccus sp.]HMU52969.1 inositol monophosphatase [Geminicoccaceae bacterium]